MDFPSFLLLRSGTIMAISPRLAARAVILHEQRLLMVNAFGGNKSNLWCAPGGGVERGASLPDNLMREVYEETGLQVSVGDPCLVNEFHDPNSSFHQVEVFFRCDITGGQLDDSWRDPEQVVSKRRFFTQSEMESRHFRPSSLAQVAFSSEASLHYDAFEPIVY